MMESEKKKGVCRTMGIVMYVKMGIMDINVNTHVLNIVDWMTWLHTGVLRIIMETVTFVKLVFMMINVEKPALRTVMVDVRRMVTVHVEQGSMDQAVTKLAH